jgi:hypothetical protein
MVKRGVVFTLSIGAWAMMAAVAVAHPQVEMRDACDATTFNAYFGQVVCKDVGGDVTIAEFLSPNVLPEGHPAWDFEPAYFKIKPDEKVTVTNEGGEVHTFTEVTAFGGGFIPFLNNPAGSSGVPECGSNFVPNSAVVFVPPGGKHEVQGLGGGMHLFECCLHPWMRAVIKVVDE